MPRFKFYLAGWLIWTSGFAAAAPSWEVSQELTPDSFLEAVNEVLFQEGVDAKSIQLEMRSLRERWAGTTGNWQALAQVFVDEKPGPGYLRKLVFDREFWLNPAEKPLSRKRRWMKVMWHEIHHLRFFPLNLETAEELAAALPPAGSIEKQTWRRKWIKLQEPLEEWAAERESLGRFKAAYGRLPDELRRDSQADMLKHAERYQTLLEDILKNVRDPEQVLRIFPARLPVDSQGNILP